MAYNETPTKGTIMFEKIKNLDPNTKSLIKFVTAQLAVVAVVIVAVKVTEKNDSEN